MLREGTKKRGVGSDRRGALPAEHEIRLTGLLGPAFEKPRSSKQHSCGSKLSMRITCVDASLRYFGLDKNAQRGATNRS
jgi:hypothetical protein